MLTIRQIKGRAWPCSDGRKEIWRNIRDLGANHRSIRSWHRSAGRSSQYGRKNQSALLKKRASNSSTKTAAAPVCACASVSD